MRLDLERHCPAVADGDHPGVLARTLQDIWGGRGKAAAQQRARVFVGAVLAPQRRDDAELRKGRLPAEQTNDALILVRRESMLGDERRRDDRITGTRLDWHQCGAAAESFFGTMYWYWGGAAGGRADLFEDHTASVRAIPGRGGGDRRRRGPLRGVSRQSRRRVRPAIAVSRGPDDRIDDQTGMIEDHEIIATLARASGIKQQVQSCAPEMPRRRRSPQDVDDLLALSYSGAIAVCAVRGALTRRTRRAALMQCTRARRDENIASPSSPLQRGDQRPAQDAALRRAQLPASFTIPAISRAEPFGLTP